MPLFGPPNIWKMKAKHDVKGLIKALSYMKNDSIRKNAAEALGESGGANAVEPLIATLKNDSQATVRYAAAKALGQISDARAVEPLIAALQDSEESVRGSAAEELGRIGDARAVESLIATLEDEYYKVRSIAVRTLGELGDARAVEPLITALDDESPYVRKKVAWALVRFGDERVGPLLLAAIKKEHELEVRSAAVDALDQLKWTPNQIESVVNAVLRNRCAVVRQFAARALGRVGDARVVEPLIAALQDSKGSVRGSAAEELGRIGDTRAVEPLIAALQDSDEFVRRHVREALAALGHHPVAEVDHTVDYTMEDHEINEAIIDLVDECAWHFENVNDYSSLRAEFRRREQEIIRPIGEKLNKAGGIALMRRVYGKGCRSALDMKWNNIGDWRG